MKKKRHSCFRLRKIASSQSFFIMKLSCFLTCFVVLTATANVEVMSQKVSLNFKNAELRDVFHSLTEQTGYGIIYSFDKLRSDQTKVTVRLDNVQLSDALDVLLKGMPYTYTIKEQNVLIIPAPAKAAQAPEQPLSIPGKVTDASGAPLQGVSVTVIGTTQGVITDANGNFVLKTPRKEGIILRFTFLGKNEVRIAYTGQTDLVVRMEDSPSAIDQVVVTGIFDRPRESYTGAVSTISKTQIQQFRGQNLIQTLRNIDPSINILGNNDWGSDPNRLPDMTIRGRSSLPLDVQALNEGERYNINTPLIIMDGFEISLQKLMDYNDNEIESINILKDAASTAIYGSRGANGVIVIISRQPAAGKLKINFTASMDVEIPDLSSYDLLNAAEKLQMEFDNGFYDDKSPLTKVALMQVYNQRYRDVIEGTDTDWLSKPLRTGISQRYNLRLEGGSQEFRWGVVTGYNHIEGVMRNSSRNNFTGQVSLQYNYKNISIRDQISVGLNNAEESNYGVFRNYTEMNPYFKPYDENGNFIRNFAGGRGGNTPIGNPLHDASLSSFDKSGYTEIINNFSIDWTIVQGLVLRGQLGLSKRHGAADTFLSPLNSYFLSNSDYATGDGVLQRGRYTYRPNNGNNYDAGITLGYTKTFAEKHQLYAGLNYTMLERVDSWYEIVGVGFTNENKNSLGNAMYYLPDGRPWESADVHIRTLGLTGNVNYTYDNRYFADLSIRTDGSSQFGANNRFGTFWSMGAGWNLHREKFLSDNGIINNLRLKVSYGQTGSQQFESYDAMRNFRYYSDNRYGVWGAAYLNGFGNEDLKWQVTDQFNVGTEVGVYNNRLTAAFDYYIKKTSNLLSHIDIPNYTGFGNYVTNVGEVKNTGFEASLSVVPVRNKDLSWTVTGRVAYNKDEITKLSEDIKRQNAAYLEQGVEVSTLFYEGRSQNSLYVVRSLGIDPASGQEFFLNSKGETVYEWSASDKVYAGVAEPTCRGNLSTLLRYKNLSLNLSFAYHWGGVAYNQTLIDRVEIMRSDIPLQNVDRRVLESRWSQPGDVVNFKKIPAAGESDMQTRATDRFVMSDRVFQMQTASIEYRLDNDRLRKAGIQNIRLGVNMSDLFYISSIDRERGLDYPFARRVGMSLSAMF